jgi:Kef-type K+ transport system membrane component KefB
MARPTLPSRDEYLMMRAMLELDFSAIKETAWLYVVVISLVGSGILFSLYAGRHLTSPAATFNRTTAEQASVPRSDAGHASPSSGAAGLTLNASSALSHLFLQLGVIISASCAVGWAFTRFGQPAVVGEMMAGILLGPSLFGLLAPKAFAFVFAPASLDALRLFSQIGVCFFMFAVGMELNLAQLRHSAHRFLVIGHSSILIPYLCGVVLSLSLYSSYARPGVSFTAFALLIGISMSITAFPVLVRILKDRKLFGSRLGQTATLCAAIGDVTAWCILAFVVAIARAADVKSAGFTLALVAVYVSAMFLIIKPLLRRFLAGALFEELDPTKGVLALVLGVVVVSSLSTEIIGIHALFGAFLAGIVMPAGGGFRKKLTVRVEHFSSVLLLPLFFAFIGLRTQVGLLNGARDWLICLGIIVVATVGKLGGTALVSRIMKMPWRESLQLGALMNTRGLMELIVLNIGYDLGILSLRIFSMLVLMAIVTTLMTGPLLDLFRAKATASV